MTRDVPEEPKPENATPEIPIPLPVPPQAVGYKRVLKRSTAMPPFLAKAVSEVVYEEAKKTEGEEAKPEEQEFKPGGVGRSMAQGIINSLSKDARRQIIDTVKTRGRNRYTRRATDAIIRRDQRRTARLNVKHEVRKDMKAKREVMLINRLYARFDRGHCGPFPGMATDRYHELLGQMDFGFFGDPE